jgi:hypothetical protein
MNPRRLLNLEIDRGLCIQVENFQSNRHSVDEEWTTVENWAHSSSECLDSNNTACVAMRKQRVGLVTVSRSPR